MENDEASTEENLGGYHYSAESEDEYAFKKTRRKDKKLRDSESSGPAPNANLLSTKNFEKEEGNVLKERVKLFHQQVKDSLKSAEESLTKPIDDLKPIASLKGSKNYFLN